MLTGNYAPGSIFLIPVRLSACEIPPIEIDGTRTLDRLQYVDLFPAEKRGVGIKKLIDAIQTAPHHPHQEAVVDTLAVDLVAVRSPTGVQQRTRWNNQGGIEAAKSQEPLKHYLYLSGSKIHSLYSQNFKTHSKEISIYEKIRELDASLGRLGQVGQPEDRKDYIAGVIDTIWGTMSLEIQTGRL